MSLIKQLSREDVMFVAGETETVYQHVAGLIVLDKSDAPHFDFEHFRQHCIERVALIPHFRWKLHVVPMGLDRPYWVEDDHFSFDHHIKRIALPSPGDEAALCEVAANLYATHLDHSKPLWEIWFIEGLEGGRCAYLQKFHHCMMDGEGAFKMIEIICDFEPSPTAKKQVDESISSARAGGVPSYNQQTTRAWRHFARLPGDAARGVYDILRPKLLEQFVWPRKPKQERPKVPTASFNGALSSERAFSTVSLPLSDLIKVKKQFGVSLNDVVLALVGTAVRGYLQDHAELPAASLRTNIPVSLRSKDDDQFSNKVTNTTVTLATNIADPKKRLEAINAESTEAKTQAHSGGKSVVEMFQMMPPILVSTIMETLPAEQAPQILGANLIVSNLHGSPIPMYIAGAKMQALYPMSILTAGMGLNVTCMSYQDSMDFGIMVDPDLIVDHEVIASRLRDALAVYLEYCGSGAKQAAGKKSVKKRAVKKKAPKTAAPKKKARQSPTKKAPVEQTRAKKAPSKQAAASKTPVKKTPVKKPPAKKPASKKGTRKRT